MVGSFSTTSSAARITARFWAQLANLTIQDKARLDSPFPDSRPSTNASSFTTCPLACPLRIDRTETPRPTHLQTLDDHHPSFHLPDCLLPHQISCFSVVRGQVSITASALASSSSSPTYSDGESGLRDHLLQTTLMPRRAHIVATWEPILPTPTIPTGILASLSRSLGSRHPPARTDRSCVEQIQ